MTPTLDRIKEETKNLNREFRERTMSFVVGGLGLVAGLAWNDAVKALIEYLLPLGRDSVLAKFIYALVISIIVVVFSVYLTRVLARKDEKNEPQ